MLLLGMLAACTGKEKASNDEKDTDTNTEDTSGPKMGGTVTGAMDSAPAGIFNPIFYSDSYENNILAFTHEGLLAQNEKLEFIPNLAKEWKFNEDQTEVTFTLEEGVKWHDGEPFTADDVVFTYKSIAHPDYIAAGGVRTDFVVRLVGAKEYTEGKSTDFPGVVAVDEHTVKFTFAEPNILALADASFGIIPEHIFKDIPMKDVPAAGASRNAGEVIGTGPFKLKELIEGEQYILEKNPDYWKGEPYLDNVVWKIVDGSVILGLLENGEIDFVADPNGFQPADYETVDALEHIEIVEQPDFGYQIMGFNVNHRAKGDDTLDPSKWTVNDKVADKKVRQAIAYAVNRQGLIDGLLYGRGIVQNSPLATQFDAYDDKTPNQYPYDPEQAKALLDEAGYVDKDGDGLREDPKGNKWVLNLNYPSGNKIRERSAPIIVEMLEEVGIDIDLRQPKEVGAYYEDLELNAQDWDLYLAGWSLSTTDPDPLGLWNSEASYNYSRWNNPAADQLLVDAVSPPDAFDPEYRNKKYSEWQVMFGDDLPALILYAQNSLWAYNKRLQGVDVLPFGFTNDPHLWNVTE